MLVKGGPGTDIGIHSTHIFPFDDIWNAYHNSISMFSLISLYLRLVSVFLIHYVDNFFNFFHQKKFSHFPRQDLCYTDITYNLKTRKLNELIFYDSIVWLVYKYKSYVNQLTRISGSRSAVQPSFRLSGLNEHVRYITKCMFILHISNDFCMCDI